MKTIIVADIRSNVVNGRISGHIVPVARNYKEILSSVANVKIAAGPAILNSFPKDECIVLPYNVCSESILDKLKILINFIVLLLKSKGNPIVLQQASVVTSFLAIALFYWWTGPLFLIQYNTAAINSRLKKLLYNLCKFKISGFICPNERVGKAFDRPYCVVTDYIHLDVPFIKRFEERKWDICMIGGISKDKGVVEAAELLSKTNIKVFIAGKINEKELEPRLFAIQNNCSNIECHFGFVSDDDYVSFINNSKYSILNYTGTYQDRSSGVVLDNIFFGTPVIGKVCSAMNIVSDNNVGFVYSKLEDVNFYALLNKQRFNYYIENIKQFYIKQREYKKTLIKFLLQNDKN